MNGTSGCLILLALVRVVGARSWLAVWSPFSCGAILRSTVWFSLAHFSNFSLNHISQGTKTRSRHLKSSPKNGGKLCEAKSKLEVLACNTQHCLTPKCIDGEFGDLNEWSSCSATCNFGFKFRYRPVAVEASGCGLPLSGNEDDYAVCDLQACLNSYLDRFAGHQTSVS